MSFPRRTDRAKWFVGLTYTTEKSGDFDQVTPTVWLKPEDEHKVIPVATDSGWMVFNIQSIGKPTQCIAATPATMGRPGAGGGRREEGSETFRIISDTRIHSRPV